MLRFAATLGFALALSAIARPARADDDCDDGFWHRVKVGFHRNNEWPEPFSTADKMHAVSPFAVMIANGWQRQNLIGDNYFDEGSKQLNNPGIERVRYILRQAPAEHRMIFVERDLNDEVTKMRIDAVQQTIATLLPKGPMPEVLVSNMVTEGRGADIVSQEIHNYMTSAPAARLGNGGHSGSAPAGGGAAPSGASGSSGGT